MNKEIEKLIELAIADGKITQQERNVILKKDKALGEDVDEVEMMIDAKLVLMKKDSNKLSSFSQIIRKVKKPSKKISVFLLIVVSLFLLRSCNSTEGREGREEREESKIVPNIDKAILNKNFDSARLLAYNLENKHVWWSDSYKTKELFKILQSEAAYQVKEGNYTKAVELSQQIKPLLANISHGGPNSDEMQYDIILKIITLLCKEGEFNEAKKYLIDINSNRYRKIAKQFIKEFSGEIINPEDKIYLSFNECLSNNAFNQAEVFITEEEHSSDKRDMQDELFTARISYRIKNNQTEKAYQLIQKLKPRKGSFAVADFSDGSGNNRSWNEYANLYNSTLDEIINVYIEKHKYEKAIAIANTYKGKAKKIGLLDPDDDDNFPMYKYVQDFNHKESKIAEIQSYIKETSKASDKQGVNKEHGNSTTIVNINNKYLGLYIFQFSDGSTQFFKFINAPETDAVNILYQDNLSGEVKIKNYQLKKFTETSGEATLENQTNASDKKKVFFRKDPNSDNGFKLIDSKGVVYTFVSS